MIHKIDPHRYYPEFRTQPPAESDYLLIFDENKVYLPASSDGTLILPTFAYIRKELGSNFSLNRFLMAEYLFSIDDSAFYRVHISDSHLTMDGTKDFHSPNVFRTFSPDYLAFAGITACQINRFRLDRRYCGRCGEAAEPGTTERAMVCPSCGMIEYPKISPAVITAIINDDKILLTKYAGGSYSNWALVAGFVEVGETFKGAVRREAMEEVGLNLKNITYYKSQPWAFSDSAMIGFFAQLDGDDTISLEVNELSTARWFTREEIPDLPTDISISQEMIMYFKNGGNPLEDRIL